MLWRCRRRRQNGTARATLTASRPTAFSWCIPSTALPGIPNREFGGKCRSTAEYMRCVSHGLRRRRAVWYACCVFNQLFLFWCDFSCISISALMLLAWWQGGHLDHKKPVLLILRGSRLEQKEEDRELADPSSPRNWPLRWRRRC